MRVRPVAAVVIMLLAASLLTACRTNVGTAASVRGERISENDVDGYLTPDAKAIPSGSTSVAPRSFVLLFLIEKRLVTALLATPPAKLPSAGEIDALTNKAVQASGGRAAVIKAVGLAGYTTSFQNLFIRTRVLEIILRQQAGDTQNQQSLGAIARALKFDAARSFPVKVSARYGTWDSTALILDPGTSVPSYLTLEPTSASGA